MIKTISINSFKTTLATAAIAAALAPCAAVADVRTSDLAVGAPSMYTVVKGDTLWDISGRFLKSPSKWPEIWNMNRDSVRNPHLIYPGDTLHLDISNGKARLVFGKRGKLSDLHLKPGVRIEDVASNAEEPLSTIDMRTVNNFLVKPLMINLEEFDSAPRVVAGDSGRIFSGAGSKLYATGLNEEAHGLYSVYRKGLEIKDPDTTDVIGYEAIHLGTVKVIKTAEVSTLSVLSSGLEISKDDRLVEIQENTVFRKAITPAPANFNGKVVRIFNNSQSTNISDLGSRTASYDHEGGPMSIVIVNKGSDDGLTEGNAVIINTSGQNIKEKGYFGFYNGKKAEKTIMLPSEAVGQAVVFKVFPRVSYAIVMNAESSIKSGYAVTSP